MIHAEDAPRGKPLRSTKGKAIFSSTFLERAPERTEVEFARRIRLKGEAVTGRELWIQGRLAEGWIPFRRISRFRSKETGDRRTVRDWTALPSDYRLRVLKSKPSYHVTS